MGMGATGAALNGGAAEMKGEDPTVPALIGAAGGAGGELASTALTSAGGKLADAVLNRGVNVPAASELKSASDQAFTALRGDRSAVYSTGSVANAADDIIDALGNQGMHSGGQGTLQILNRLANPPSSAVGVPSGGIEEAQQGLNQLIRDNPGTTEATAAGIAKSKLDAFSANPPAGSVVEGRSQDYVDARQAARGNWATYKRSGTLTGALDRSEGAAEAGNGSLTAKLATRANTILNSPRLSQGLTADDRSSLGDIRAGTPTMRATRFLSSQFGHSGVLNLLLAEGGIEHFGPAGLALGLVPPAVRSLSNAVGNRSARAAMSAADEATRMNSPLFREWVQSGLSAVPRDVSPATASARKLAAAMTASGANAGLGQ